jgi:hypothetical protein
MSRFLRTIGGSLADSGSISRAVTLGVADCGVSVAPNSQGIRW